jgi:hypothetical protein
MLLDVVVPGLDRFLILGEPAGSFRWEDGGCQTMLACPGDVDVECTSFLQEGRVADLVEIE